MERTCKKIKVAGASAKSGAEAAKNAAAKARPSLRNAHSAFSVVSLLFLVCSLALPAPSGAVSPTDQLRGTVEEVLTIVRNPKLKAGAQKENLRTQLARAIERRFDFSEMAKRSLGPHWGRRTSQEQREFVRIFAGLLERLCVDRIETYIGGENILYAREVQDGNFAEVNTKVNTENSREKLSINYKLYRVDSEWRVYDLVIEDISLVNNYRSQFDRVIARSSFENLVRVLQEKQSRSFVKTGPVAEQGGEVEQAPPGRLDRPSVFARVAVIILKLVQDSRGMFRGST